MSTAKCRPFCKDLDVFEFGLNPIRLDRHQPIRRCQKNYHSYSSLLNPLLSYFTNHQSVIYLQPHTHYIMCTYTLHYYPIGHVYCAMIKKRKCILPVYMPIYMYISSTFKHLQIFRCNCEIFTLLPKGRISYILAIPSMCLVVFDTRIVNKYFIIGCII